LKNILLHGTQKINKLNKKFEKEMAKMRTEFTSELEAQETINNDLNNSIYDLKKKVNLLSQVYFRQLSFEVEKKIKNELGIATDVNLTKDNYVEVELGARDFHTMRLIRHNGNNIAHDINTLEIATMKGCN
jgi:hypothetical protein